MDKRTASGRKLNIDMADGFPKAEVDKLDVGLWMDGPDGGRVCLRIGKAAPGGGVHSEEFFLPAEVAIMLAEQLVIAAKMLTGGSVA